MKRRPEKRDRWRDMEKKKRLEGEKDRERDHQTEVGRDGIEGERFLRKRKPKEEEKMGSWKRG